MTRFWHPIADMHAVEASGEFVLERGEGCHLWDDQGNRYIDLSSGPIVSNIGHGNARVAEAMAKQARTLDFAYSRVARHQPNLDLSERIASLAGPGFERVFLSSGGSEAIEIAIKFLRSYDLAFNGGFSTAVLVSQRIIGAKGFGQK